MSYYISLSPNELEVELKLLC